MANYPRLTYPCYYHTPLAVKDKIHRPLEARIHPIHKPLQDLSLQGNDLLAVPDVLC